MTVSSHFDCSVEHFHFSIKTFDPLPTSLKTHDTQEAPQMNLTNAQTKLLDIALPATEQKSEPLKVTTDTWIGNSGASCHMTNDDTGMYDFKEIREDLTVGSGKSIIATKIGKLKLNIR